MIEHAKTVAAIAILGLLGASGCNRFMAPAFKVESEQTLTIPVGATTQVSTRTHNGRVNVSATDESHDEISVLVKTVARGITPEDANECMAAIELINEQDGATRRLGWKWNPSQKSRWQASVSFDIVMPAELGVHAATHNGAVTVSGVNGDCHVQTHNGRIRIEAGSARVDASSHNGGITIVAPVETVTAKTHNGGIKLVANGATNLTGQVTTHNGAVTVSMDETATARFICSSHNGGISSKLDLTDMHTKRQSLAGRKGDATGELRISTFNGSIVLK